MKRSSLSGKKTPFVAGRNLRVQGLAGNVVQGLDGMSGCSSCGAPRRTLRTRGIAGMGDGMLETVWAMLNPDVEYTPPTPGVSKTPAAAQPPAAGGGGGAATGAGQPNITALQQVLFSQGCDPHGIDGRWGPNTSAAVRCYINRFGRNMAVTLLGASYVTRAEQDAQTGATTPSPSAPAPADTTPPPVQTAGLDPTAIIRQLTGGGSSALGPFGDPMFLGLMGVGVLAAILIAGQLKKGKKGKK